MFRFESRSDRKINYFKPRNINLCIDYSGHNFQSPINRNERELQRQHVRHLYKNSFILYNAKINSSYGPHVPINIWTTQRRVFST